MGELRNRSRGVMCPPVFLYPLAELGVWEKQSSCYTQFKASENIVAGNIMYNGKRVDMLREGHEAVALTTHPSYSQALGRT